MKFYRIRQRFFTPDDGGTGGNTENTNTTNPEENSTETKDPKPAGKVFTQEQLDKIISDRLNREKTNWEKKIEDEKKKAAMTETERLKKEREEADLKAQESLSKAEQRLIKSEIMVQASKLNIIDIDAAYKLLDKEELKVDANDNISGVAEALKTLIEEKPYLVGKETKPAVTKTGDNQNEDNQTKGGFNMNDLIRKAVGR